MAQRGSLLGRVLWLIPVSYLGFMLVTVSRTLASSGRQASSGGSAAALPVAVVAAGQPAAPVNSDQQTQELVRLQSYVEKRTEELEKLISELTVGSGIYTALLGLFAYFGLKEAKSDADRIISSYKDELQRLKDEAKDDHTARAKQFEDLEMEIRADIPNFMEMQKALRDVLFRVRTQVESSQLWMGGEGRASYVKMTEEQRQSVILAEFATASLDYFRLPSTNVSVVAQIYGHLTEFYAARASAGDARHHTEADLSRARIYIDRACQVDGSNPGHLARRAALTLSEIVREGPRGPSEKLARAESDLAKALELDPKFPNALYSMAWVADEKGELVRAIDLLDKLISQRDTLPPDIRGRRLTNAYVNRACARAKQISGANGLVAGSEKSNRDDRRRLRERAAGGEAGKQRRFAGRRYEAGVERRR